MGYKVEYHVSSQSAWLYKTLFDPVIRSLLVDDLELFHTYEFRIRAFNMFGHSGWSNVSVIYLEIGMTMSHRVFGNVVRFRLSSRYAVKP